MYIFYNIIYKNLLYFLKSPFDLNFFQVFDIIYVIFNGKIVRMVQATDGLWYAYFADRNQAQLADQTVEDGGSFAGNGLDFGTFCERTDGVALVDLSDTQGFTINSDTGDQGTTALGTTACATDASDSNNVVREPKTPNGNVALGQIGIAADTWPIIQLYDLNPTGNVVIQYNKGGNPQTVTLTFDTLDGTLDASLYRDTYPRGSSLHATLTDQAMNIDPTDEDSWTFDTENGAVFYQFFDESGLAAGGCGDGVTICIAGASDVTATATPDVSGSLADFFFEDGGLLFIDPDAQGVGTPVVAFQDNDDQQFIEAFDVDADGDVDADDVTAGGIAGPVTLVELGPNSGVYANYDELDTSNIVITDGALRGTSATVNWDDTGYSVVVDFDYAAIDIQPIDDTWNSGEEIPVVLNDKDANLNSRFDEDLDLNNPAVDLVPSVTIGSPLTLETLADATVNTAAGPTSTDIFGAGDVVQVNSQRALLVNGAPSVDVIAPGDTFTFVLDATYADLYDVWSQEVAPNGSQQVFNSFNYDIRGILDNVTGGSIDSFEVNFDDSGLFGPALTIGATPVGFDMLINDDGIANGGVADLSKPTARPVRMDAVRNIVG